MERLNVLLQAGSLLAIVGLGVVIYVESSRAHDERAELICVQRAQATATVALLAPAERVDPEGRLEAMGELGNRIDSCGD
jgi:hypothetical protein